MPNSDASKWDDRYSSGVAPTFLQPPEVVETHLSHIGTDDSCLDVASGWGDAGLQLAKQGATVCLTDISSVALAAVVERAELLRLAVDTVALDLETAAVPVGPWDAITCIHYLDRALLPRLGETLAAGGRLVCAIATTINLERHERPSARFLLEPGELETLVPALTVTHASEAWRANGVHEAWLIAQNKIL